MKRLAILSLLVAAPAAFAQSLTIDDFTTGAFTSPMVLNNTTIGDVRFNTGSMFGGSRQVAGTYFVNALNQDMTVSIAGSGLEITNAGAGAAGNVDLQYTGYQLGASFGSLAAYGQFELDFAANSRALAANIYVHDTSGDFGTLQQTVPSDPTSPEIFLFSGFTGVGTIDWGHVDAITVSFQNLAGGDYAVSNIKATAVPEPATLGAAAIGIAGLIARRRKRKAA